MLWLQNHRVTQIAVDQLSRIRHPNFINLSANNNDGNSAGQSDDVTANSRYNRVEVIKVRRKRKAEPLENPDFLEFSVIKSRLLRSYRRKYPNTYLQSEFKNEESEKPLAEAVTVETENSQNTLASSDDGRDNFDTKSFNSKAKVKTSNTNNNKVLWKEETKSAKKSESRSAEKIPSWQWNFMKKSLKRDKETAKRYFLGLDGLPI